MSTTIQERVYSQSEIDNMEDEEFRDIFGDVSRESVGGTPSVVGTIYPGQGNDSLGVGLDVDFETVGLNRDIYEGIGTITDMGQVGFPETDESVVGEAGVPVTIVQRNESGEEIGRVPGVRIGVGDNARVITLDDLSRINRERTRLGQGKIIVGNPGFFPEIIDPSGAAVNNTNNENLDPGEQTNSSTNRNMRTKPSNPPSGTSGPTIYTGEGSGVGQVRVLGGGVIEIPEGQTVLGHALDLVRQGTLSAAAYKDLVARGTYGRPNAGDIVTTPELLPNEVVNNT